MAVHGPCLSLFHVITVLIVDDQPAVLRGLRMRLAVEPDLTVVGEALTGEEALVAARRLRPDVVVMDIAMPGIGGIAATRQIVAAHLAAVVVMSLHDDSETRGEANSAGAASFVAKHEAGASLPGAIRMAAAERTSPASPPTQRLTRRRRRNDRRSCLSN